MKYTQWLQDYKEVEDKRVLWDLIKYKIRQETIKYGKEKAKQRKLKLEKTEYKLREAENHFVDNPNEENKLEFEICKTNYEKAYEYITKGSILRSRVKWYEEGEKNTKYFLNLENHQKKKSCIRRIYNEHNKLISNPKEILKELNKFYQNLYSENGKKPSIETKNKFLKNENIPVLDQEESKQCEGQLTMNECFQALESFECNKSPGNDGLTAEFYKCFWTRLGEQLVECLNFSHIHGRLSNSQRQAIIKLIEKKEKDRTGDPYH